MAGFNTRKSGNVGMNPTINHEGDVAHKLGALEAIFAKTLGSFFGESTFYEDRSSESDFKKLVELVREVPEKDKEYVLKVAELGRLCNMIEYPLQILTVACNDDRFKGNSFVDEVTGRNKLNFYADRLILRAKDITSIAATQLAVSDSVYGNKKGIPMQMKKILKRKIEGFDRYKLSKGLSKNREVSLADVINLVHPRPKNEDMASFYKDILDGNAVVGDGEKTVNSELTNKGKEKEGYDINRLREAILKDNLQNIVKNLASFIRNGAIEGAEGEKTLKYVCDKISSAEEVRKSKLLPFRFYSAYAVLTNNFPNYGYVSRVKDALLTAVDNSITNLDELEGNTCILVDLSGSMGKVISDKSIVKAMDIACLLGAISYKKSFGDFYVFSDDCVKVDVSNKGPVMDIARYAKGMIRHGGTRLDVAIDIIADNAKKMNMSYDNFILLTDGDCYGYSGGTLTVGIDYNFGYIGYGKGGGYSGMTADQHINKLIGSGVMKKVWINNLLGNDFVIYNTNNYTKNLITGFSESFFEMIGIYGAVGSKNIKDVIDEMLEKKRRGNKRK